MNYRQSSKVKAMSSATPASCDEVTKCSKLMRKYREREKKEKKDSFSTSVYYTIIVCSASHFAATHYPFANFPFLSLAYFEVPAATPPPISTTLTVIHVLVLADWI